MEGKYYVQRIGLSMQNIQEKLQTIQANKRVQQGGVLWVQY